jgi:hypothetical protein
MRDRAALGGRHKALSQDATAATIHLLACGAGFIAGLFFFFTIGQAFSGLGFASFTGEPFSALTDPVRDALRPSRAAHGMARAALAGGDAGVPGDDAVPAGLSTSHLVL